MKKRLIIAAGLIMVSLSLILNQYTEIHDFILGTMVGTGLGLIGTGLMTKKAKLQPIRVRKR